MGTGQERHVGCSSFLGQRGGFGQHSEISEMLCSPQDDVCAAPHPTVLSHLLSQTTSLTYLQRFGSTQSILVFLLGL